MTVSTGGQSRLTFIGGSGSAKISVSTPEAHITLGSGVLQVTNYKAAPPIGYEVDLASTGTLSVSNFRATDSITLGQGVAISSESYAKGVLSVLFSNGAHATLTGAVHSI
jgi:hypothetical protein